MWVEIEAMPVMAEIEYSEVFDIRSQYFDQLDSDDDSGISSTDSDDSHGYGVWGRTNKYCCLHWGFHPCNISSSHCHCNYASLVLADEIHINDLIINKIRLARQKYFFEKEGSLKNICLRFLSRYLETSSIKYFAPPQTTKELFHELKLSKTKLGQYNCVCKKNKLI